MLTNNTFWLLSLTTFCFALMHACSQTNQVTFSMTSCDHKVLYLPQTSVLCPHVYSFRQVLRWISQKARTPANIAEIQLNPAVFRNRFFLGGGGENDRPSSSPTWLRLLPLNLSKKHESACPKSLFLLLGSNSAQDYTRMCCSQEPEVVSASPCTLLSVSCWCLLRGLGGFLFPAENKQGLCGKQVVTLSFKHHHVIYCQLTSQ